MSYYRTASIMLNSGQSKEVTSDIFIAQPDANKEALAGKLFLIIELNANRTNSLKIINFLINNLNHNYYNNEKIILRERISTLKIEHIFEAALSKTNKNLFEFLTREKIKINPKSINATVGIIFENYIYFASIGSNKSFLIYKNEKSTSSQNLANKESANIYKIIDINKKTNNNKPSQLKINKLFSDIISGEIPSSGYFLFSNEALPEYFSSKQLIDIITKLPPAGAVEQIKNTLTKANFYVPFLGIIIKNTILSKESVLETPKENDLGTIVENSVSRLNDTETETEKLLTPSGLINYKKYFKDAKAIILNTIFKNRDQNKKTSFFIKDKIFLKRKQSLLSIKKLFLILKNIFTYIFSLSLYLLKILTNKKKLLGFLGNIKNLIISLKDSLILIIKKIVNLNVKNKILLSIGIISILLFTVTTTLKLINNKNQEEEKITNDIIVALEQKQSQVDAHLLYSNEDGAKKLLNEISELLKKLPTELDENKKKYDKYFIKNENHLEKIRHSIIIENPKEISNFSNLNSQAKPINIIIADNKIYAGDSEQKTVYILDLEDNTATAITDLSTDIKNLRKPTKDNDNNIYYLNFNNHKEALSIIKLDNESKELSKTQITLPNDIGNIAATASFNNRLYVIDSIKNNIFRLIKTADGFTRRDNWLKDNSNLSGAISLDIDGQIYVLFSNGDVQKFLKGEKQEFKLDSIEPPFEDTKKITISSDLEYIYILEPKNNRLAIFNKGGDFILQYKSDKFNSLKDFSVDEANKKIYFLNNNSILEIDGVHFDE